MMQNCTKTELKTQLLSLQQAYTLAKSQQLSLNMSRGVPSKEQLDLASPMLSILQDEEVFGTEGFDERNYGQLDGIPQAKKLFADLAEVSAEQVIVGGNSSLNLMYDTICRAMLFGVVDSKRPWKEEKTLKCLCPVPGYDRHFAISELLGIEMISVPMTSTGPDMEQIERLVLEDKAIKFIWCVPKYSNPQGITYDESTVKRLAAMKTAAVDFRIIWDNAYCVHDLTDTPDTLYPITTACQEAGHPNRVFEFTSTSKISYAGSGISAMISSIENTQHTKKLLGIQTIGYNKINQLAHVRFFKDVAGIKAHMKKHRDILKPKFDLVQQVLTKEILSLGIGAFHLPQGGYFVSFDALPGCAKRIVSLCKEAGVVLTGAGATFPYQNDPEDKNIRLAPTAPSLSQLQEALHVFCLCVKIASAERLIGE